ncbi:MULTISPECIES: DUF5677 domain-containing protein [Paenibacillus]|uniref:DUF5677 domain-containing protein n=1 Tax=Paenibacillus TaxID=44249 RepID=UPI0005ECBFB9|nr:MULTISPECIES: DUF5677 domain-containing protein [Paenibacillus]AUS27797.1 hypothetical protein C1A50_3633 [Paenibacillus polymyxa]KAF6585950.1 hypothetical protein G9G57_04430 [Paenibacillus sp. EKM211P]KJK31321.1 hypothetical protein TY89_08015 [Paenibacillus polymyxa]WOZ37089.1 DUF5677 domain-containing protein [Paenibacillus polymyxa]
MYIKEVVSDMEMRYSKSLEAHKLMVLELDKYLLGGEVPNNLLSHTSLYFLAKFHKSLLSFRLLVVSGFNEDASIILRTMVEIAIVIAYISKEPEKRLDRFIEYRHIAEHRLLETIEKHYNGSKIDEQRRNKIKENYEANKRNYKNKAQWSEISIADMAKDVSMDFWYEAVYKLDSSYVHSNITASKGFMFDDNDELSVAVGPLSFSATDILTKSCELSRIVLYIYLKNMDLSTDGLIEKWNECQRLIQEEFESIREEVE